MVNNNKPLMRIFCYIPTPRIWKSSITARFIDVNIEVRGTKPPEIKNWLWDFDARPLTEEDKIKKENTVIEDNKAADLADKTIADDTTSIFERNKDKFKIGGRSLFGNVG